MTARLSALVLVCNDDPRSKTLWGRYELHSLATQTLSLSGAGSTLGSSEKGERRHCGARCWIATIPEHMDTGVQARLQILRTRAEECIIGPLRTHRWSASIAREVETDDGYLIIEAERGGTTHKMALLYSSAISNATYRQLSTEVSNIFVNGQLYKLEAYAYGISTPIMVADDFFDVLLAWNTETEDSVGTAPAEHAEPIAEYHRVIQSENPIHGIWLRLRQLHSVTLARKLLEKRVLAAGGRDDASLRGRAEGLSFAVRNATDYFRVRDEQSVSQRVLNLYYGTLSFAFAEMLADPRGPSTLSEIEDFTKQGHGLYTIDGAGGGFEELVIGVIASGFFSRWMSFHDKAVDALPAKKPRAHSDLSKQTPDTYVTLEELFARIPDVGDLFTEIFSGPPAWVEPIYASSANKGPSLSGSGQSTQSAYVDLVDRSGRLTRGGILRFRGDLKEVAEVTSDEPGRHFRTRIDHPGHQYWHQALPLHHSSFTSNLAGSLIQPLFGCVTEFRSISLTLLYGLSIIVRYRPSIWRRVQDGDWDQYRAIVESFLSVAERVLPDQFLAAMLGVPVYARQPSIF